MSIPNDAYSHHVLATPVTALKGVGPRVAEKFAKMSISTVEDLLYTLPNRYEDRRDFKKIAHLKENIYEVFSGEILACGESVSPRRRRKIFEVLVSDGTGTITLKWFHYRKEWIKKRFAVGKRGVFIGEVKRYGAVKEVYHPDVEFLAANQSLDDFKSSDPLTFGRILPVYPLTEGLTQYTARQIWKQAVDLYSDYVQTDIPEQFTHKHGLLSVSQALKEVHWPSNDSDMDRLEKQASLALKTIVYDEFFFLELGLALKRKGVILEKGIPFEVTHKFTKPLAAQLPFQMTNAQRRVLGEIKNDLMSPHPMNRLIQGDVGCGKTIVALMTSLVAIENNTQVAVVAPTEILAEQHYLQFHRWLENLGLKTAFLRGKMPVSEKKLTLDQIRSGEMHLVVGTHAVLQEGVEFKSLGLGIIDEQHRFGVKQRATLKNKGTNPHILVMTATPIPRTLSLTLYGDLAISVIDEMPPGRSPVKTFVQPENHRNQIYQSVQEQLSKGHQVYVVYPLIEESEKSDLQAATEGAETLKNDYFPESSVGLLHGRMKPEEKEAIMTKFKNKDIDILVSTTVIEVGIDVPNATLMLIEHAERFGLAQLHQLRGRVGRGSAQGYCILVKSVRCSEDGLKRLEVMRSTNDGFRIAEADLEIRGPGEFLGTRQSGLPDFRVANIIRDSRTLEQARQDAFQFADSEEFKTSPKIQKELSKRWGSRLELASIG